MSAKQSKLIPYVSVFLLALLTCAVIFFSGCSVTVDGAKVVRGNGTMTNGSLSYDGAITKLDLNKIKATFNITPEQGKEVTYSIDDNLKSALDITVTNGVLKITSNNGTYLSGKAITFNISSDQLQEINVNDEATIKSNGPLTADTFTMTVDGAATATLALNTQTVTLTINGAGDITLSGTTGKLNVQNNGASAVKARGLVAQDVSINISGAGKVEVDAEKTLDVAISGIGSVTYWGNPQLSQSTSGLASVKKGN